MIKRIDENPRMSQAVIHGGLVYLSGQIDPSMAPSVTGQTRAILTRIDDLLKQAGSGKDRLIGAQIWLTDMRCFDEMNAVWDDWIGGQNAPARATVEARLAHPDLLVEIAVTAAQ
ncbi:MAG: RidA family protein [Erythrobacter sp.]|uniref:RidA family protein n=1 Tax=Erythrobacter sp. TaxID=1042 RepID=UPI0026271347|nr:RidA family protein [Erythrobacter sp.]MDJ0978146.1 RidA family protein [Erythrobacter sp.]